MPKSITLFNVFLSSPAENHSMSRKLARLLLSPPLYFSYGQFGVIDRDSDLHGLYWEERHNSQGFARRDSIACFRTLAVHGYTDVSVALGPYEPAANYDRVISVPFHVRSGIVAVEGPEEVNLVKRNVELAPGNYRLTAAQQYAAAEGREETIDLYFERVDEPLKRSEVLLADEELNPVYPLLETADEP
jgi:Competence protein J (ComJ)